MKTLTVALIIVALSLVLTGVLTSTDWPDVKNGSGLEWKSFDEGSLLAVQQKKKLLVDVYTDWCSWCTKMDKDVYPNGNVRRFLESRFVVVKLDAESNKKLSYQGSTMSEREFARVVGVTGYPTTLFFDEDMKPITFLPGYLKAETFVNILTFVGENHYKNSSYNDYLKTLR